MDLATLIGLIGSLAVVVVAVSLGNSTEVFINIPSLIIVVGGTFTIVMMKFSLKQSLGAVKVGTSFAGLNAARQLGESMGEDMGEFF